MDGTTFDRLTRSVANGSGRCRGGGRRCGGVRHRNRSQKEQEKETMQKENVPRQSTGRRVHLKQGLLHQRNQPRL